MITAKIAKKYNKKIFAVPGPLTSSVSMGTAILIKQGALVVTNVDDLLFEYGKLSSTELYSNISKQRLNKLQKKIVYILSQEPMGIDEITRLSNRSTSEVSADLTILTLKKFLTLNEGKYYLIKGAQNVI